MIEDAADDDSAPPLDELKCRAGLLRGANPVPERYRGKKGEALRELAEIETRLQQDLCIKDLISIKIGLSGSMAHMLRFGTVTAG
jgi:hypothetical protein